MPISKLQSKLAAIDLQRDTPERRRQQELYDAVRIEVLTCIPHTDLYRVLGQDGSEYDPADNLGFLLVYHGARFIIPKDFTVIDFGCGLAPQSYLFADHAKYIGVDVCTLERFTPGNAEHYVGSIQQFIRDNQKLCMAPRTAAICSYVPDRTARAMVNRMFATVINYYPE